MKPLEVSKNQKERLITFASLTKKDGQFIVGDCKYKDNFTLKDLKNKKVLAGRTGGMPLMMFKTIESTDLANKISVINTKMQTVEKQLKTAKNT